MVVTSSYNAPTSHARRTVYAPGICMTMFAGSTFTFHKEYPLTLIERLRDLFALLFFASGELSKHFDNVEKGASIETHDVVTLEDSPANQSGTSSSGTESATTPKTVVAANELSLNDAMLNDTSVISSDGSLSSMSDLSGNTSFHEKSIAFSSTCIKAPSDLALRSDSTVEFGEGVNDSAGVTTAQ